MDKYKYNKYKLKYTLLKQRLMKGGDSDGDSDDENLFNNRNRPKINDIAASRATAAREAIAVGEAAAARVTASSREAASGKNAAGTFAARAAAAREAASAREAVASREAASREAAARAAGDTAREAVAAREAAAREAAAREAAARAAGDTAREAAAAREAADREAEASRKAAERVALAARVAAYREAEAAREAAERKAATDRAAFLEAASGRAASAGRATTTVEYPARYGLGTITSAEYYKIIDKYLNKHHISYDPSNGEYEEFDKIEKALPGEPTSSDDMSSQFYQNELERTATLLAEFGNTCDRHTEKHKHSEHRLYLYNYIKRYIENFRKWQIEHVELYNRNEHPDSCKYCNNIHFWSILDNNNNKIDELVELYNHECVKRCRFDMGFCGRCDYPYFSTTASCACDVDISCEYHDLYDFDERLD